MPSYHSDGTEGLTEEVSVHESPVRQVDESDAARQIESCALGYGNLPHVRNAVVSR
jgi:hypothetical protein